MSKRKYVYVLRNCDLEWKSRDGFYWGNEIGKQIAAPDFKPTTECGNGLHGWLWGAGYINASQYNDLDNFLVLRVLAKDVIDLGGKVKFPRCTIVFAGTRKAAVEFIAKKAPANTPINWATQTGGYGATQTAGHRATQTAGHRATQTAEYGATQTAEGGATQTAGDHATQTAGYKATQTAEDHTTQTAGEYSTQTAGHYSTQTAGDHTTQTGGYNATQTAGDIATQTAAYKAIQTARHHSTQTAGDQATQTAGYKATQTAGDHATQTAGDRATQTAGHHSTQTAGGNSFIRTGLYSKVRAGIDSVVWFQGMLPIQIDGLRYKVDTFYHVVNHEIVEWSESCLP